MAFVRWCARVLLGSALALLASTRPAAAEGEFGASKPAAGDAAESGFDALRKPPIPTFLSHDDHVGWVQFFYPPSARDRVAPLIAQADDLRAEIAEDLGQTPLDGVEVRIARVLEEMGTLAPQASPPSAQATSIAYPKLKLIVLSLGAVGSTEPVDLREGFRRELARLAFAEAIGTQSVPKWFAEGFVQHFARDGEWGREWTLYRSSMRHRTLGVVELDDVLEKGGAETELAVAESADFVGFLLRPEKRAQFAAAIEKIRQGEAFDAAVMSAYRGADTASLESRWLADRRRWTTLTTVLLTLGVPLLFALGWFGMRAVRRYRRRAATSALEPKKPKRGTSPTESPRVHIVLSRRDDRPEPPVISEAEIPKVEHEGEWHTLH
jgi:hypothetical protein